jgi:hypothetical protein
VDPSLALGDRRRDSRRLEADLEESSCSDGTDLRPYRPGTTITDVV